MTPPSPHQRFALNVVSGLALVVGLVLFYAIVLGPGKAATAPLLAGFDARSYAPGDVATLRIDAGTPRRVTLQFFLAGATLADVPGVTGKGWDKPTFGKPGS